MTEQHKADPATRKAALDSLTQAFADAIRAHAEPIFANSEDTGHAFMGMHQAMLLAPLEIQFALSRDSDMSTRSHLSLTAIGMNMAMMALCEANGSMLDGKLSDIVTGEAEG